MKHLRHPLSFGLLLLPLGWPALYLGTAPALTGEAKDTPQPRLAARQPVKLTEEALRIHRAALLIDGHNDLPWQFRAKHDLSFRKIDLRKPQPELHTDIPRLRRGGVGAQFWSAYVPAETRKKGTAVRD